MIPIRWMRWWCAWLAIRPRVKRSAAKSSPAPKARFTCGRASSMWRPRRSTTRRGRPKRCASSTAESSFELEVAVVDQLGPLAHFVHHRFSERLRRAADDFRTKRGETFAHVRHLERAVHLAVEDIHHSARHFRRAEERKERAAVDRIALLGERRRLRQQRETLGARDAEQPELSGANMRVGSRIDVERTLDLAAEQRGDERRAALVWHMYDFDARHLLEELVGELVGARVAE